MRVFLTLITLVSAAFVSHTAKAVAPSCNEAVGDRAFDPFLFRVLGDCQRKEDGSAFFRATTNVTYPVLGKDKNGRDLVIYTRLNLFSDHTYWGEYSEDALIATTGSVTELQSTYFVQIGGGWRIVGDRLIIDHIGEVKLIAGTQEYPKAELTFTSTVHDPRLLGHKIQVGPATTDVGPHGESINEYCSVK